MGQNPTLSRLGLTTGDRAVIIHTDDIGVSAASVAAARDLWQTRIISSSAVMVPCAWFGAAAKLCRDTPWIDMGVHVTLTSEWYSIRWGLISTRDPASGLLDPEGCFFRSTRDAQAHAAAEAAATEMDAQVQRALAAGVDVTHIDTHMGSVFHPKLLRAYVATALKYRVPPMLARLSEADMRAWGFDSETIAYFHGVLAELEDSGVPMLDRIVGMPLDKPENRFEQVCAMFDSLPAGISYFIIHPSHDTPEARAMGPDWPSRAGDLATFLDERVRVHLKRTGLQAIGWRELRALMRG